MNFTDNIIDKILYKEFYVPENVTSAQGQWYYLNAEPNITVNPDDGEKIVFQLLPKIRGVLEMRVQVSNANPMTVCIYVGEDIVTSKTLQGGTLALNVEFPAFAKIKVTGICLEQPSSVSRITLEGYLRDRMDMYITEVIE